MMAHGKLQTTFESEIQRTRGTWTTNNDQKTKRHKHQTRKTRVHKVLQLSAASEVSDETVLKSITKQQKPNANILSKKKMQPSTTSQTPNATCYKYDLCNNERFKLAHAKRNVGARETNSTMVKALDQNAASTLQRKVLDPNMYKYPANYKSRCYKL